MFGVCQWSLNLKKDANGCTVVAVSASPKTIQSGIYNYDGKLWNPLLPLNSNINLNLVTGSSADDLYFASALGVVFKFQYLLGNLGLGGFEKFQNLYHYDGDLLEPLVVDPFTTLYVSDVFAARDTKFITGLMQNADSGSSLIWKSQKKGDKEEWVSLQTPSYLPKEAMITDIFALSESEFYMLAVGLNDNKDNKDENNMKGLVYHYINGNWITVPLTGLNLDLQNTLFTEVWASSPSDVYIVGMNLALAKSQGGVDALVMLRYNGKAW